MASVEDEYFARIESVLGLRTPKPGENPVVMLTVPEWHTRAEAQQFLSTAQYRKLKMADLTVEVGEAERRYLRPIFGNQWKATQCRAVLITLAQINSALANQESILIEWLRKHPQDDVVDQRCARCGAKVTSSASFCSQCGRRTDETLTMPSADPDLAVTQGEASRTRLRISKQPKTRRSVRQIELAVLPSEYGPHYQAVGSWSIREGSVTIELVPDSLDAPSYSVTGEIDSESGSVTLELVSLDPLAPDYSVYGDFEKATGFLDLTAYTVDLDSPDYTITGTIDLASGLVTLDALTNNIDFTDYSVIGSI